MNALKKLLKNELIRSSSIYLIASTLSASIPFLLLPILTRFLTPAEYGEVAMFTVLVSLFGALCGLSVHGAANRKYFDYMEEPAKLAEYIFMCMIILLISSTILLIIVLQLSPFLSGIFSISESWIIAAVIVAAFGFITKLRLGQWQVIKNSFKYGIFQISQSLGNAILSILFVVVLSLGVTGRLFGIIISSLVFACIATLSLRKNKMVKVSWNPEMAYDALKFGIPLIPHIIGIFLLSSIDRVVITNKLGLEDAGIYMVAIQLSLAASIILTAVNQAFVPWLFERLKRNIYKEKKIIVKITYGYYLLLLMGVALAFWLGDDILRLIAGPAYYPAGELIGWVILAKGFHGGYLMVTNYFFYTKKTGVLSTITIVTGLLNITLLYTLIHYFGLIGVVWAYCISKLVQWITTWYMSNKILNMPWLTVFSREK